MFTTCRECLIYILQLYLNLSYGYLCNPEASFPISPFWNRPCILNLSGHKRRLTYSKERPLFVSFSICWEPLFNYIQLAIIRPVFNSRASLSSIVGH